MLSLGLALPLCAPRVVLAAPAASKAAIQAVCAVCGPREGADVEPVNATATLRGKTFSFCAVACKVEFLENPTEFLDTGEGQPAPSFAQRDLQGRTLKLSDFKGQVLLLDFWGTFCKPCVAALPKLQALHKKYAAKKFSVIGLAIDEKPELVAKFVKKSGATYPMAQATEKLWSDYKISVLPSLVLVGRDGKILRRFGEKTSPEVIVQAIESALAEKTPDTASEKP